MDAPEYVYFEGHWSPQEREVVQEAAEAAENAGLPAPVRELGAPWVATRQALGDTTFYMAARQQGESALMDQSAEGLADRIRRFAEQKGDAVSDPASVFQLVYESTEARPMTDTDLRNLLRASRSKNERLGITGLLLYANGQFFQVLEGPESEVRALYSTIREDPRHTNVETLLTTSVDERTFPDWEMGLERPRAVVDEEVFSPFLQTGALPSAAKPITEVLEALERFRQRASRE